MEKKGTHAMEAPQEEVTQEKEEVRVSSLFLQPFTTSYKRIEAEKIR